MFLSGAFTVYALGLRHGADPDHLAAIDNLTRNSIECAPRGSRFVGTLFAGGHTVMVLAIAGIVGFVGARFAAHGALIETAGTWISIAVLLGLAAMNVGALARGRSERPVGLKTLILPPALRNGRSPWLAVPVGLLFGFGFETSSQIAAYSLAFGADAGVFGALFVGAMFCLGMICTDTLDSLFVHRAVSYRNGGVPRAMRVWIWTVTLLAIAVALYELVKLLGWPVPLSDFTVSAFLVGSLFAVFAWVFLATRAGGESRLT